MAGQSSYPLKRLVWCGILAALCTVFRLFLAPLPNIQPVTSLLIIICLYISAKDAAIIASLSLILSNIFLGLGPWTLAQIAAYFSIIILTKGLSQPIKSHPLPAGALWASLTGYLYGLIISLIQAPFYGISNFLVYYLGGLLFDSYHALGNLIFYLLLYRLIPLLVSKYPH